MKNGKSISIDTNATLENILSASKGFKSSFVERGQDYQLTQSEKSKSTIKLQEN